MATNNRRKSTISIDPNSAVELSRTKLRRKSYGFGYSSVRLSRSSQVHGDIRRPPLIYLPTYQLNPHYPFHPLPVEKILEKALVCVENHKYNDTDSPALAMQMAYEIMTEARELHFDRYRIISVVTIGQKRSQSYNNAVAFLWDPERDHYVDAERQNFSCLFQVTVFFIYLD